MKARWFGRNAGEALALLLAWSIALAPALPAAEATAPEAAKLVERGITAYQEGNYEEALQTLNRARALAPSNSSTALYIGLANLRLGKSEDAISAWQGYTRLPPSTREEQERSLPEDVRRHLTLLIREANEKIAREAIAKEQRLGPGDPRTVAITYYRNLGSAELTPLQKGLTALLIDDVSKVKELRVVERDRLQAMLQEMRMGNTGLVDERTAPKVGKLLGAGKVTTGSYVDPSKGELRLDSLVAESGTSAVLGTQEATGKIDEFFELEKALALTILADLGYGEKPVAPKRPDVAPEAPKRPDAPRAAPKRPDVAPPPVVTKPLPPRVLDEVRKPQTQSMPAMVAFSNGLDAKDRGDFVAARRELERAVKEDPNFDLARKELALLPLLFLSTAAIISTVEGAAPSAQSAAATVSSSTAAGTAGTAGGISLGTTAAIVGGVAVVAGGIAGGLAASGGGDDDDGPSGLCNPEQFECRGGTCIDRSLVCNTQANCPDGDDEAASICESEAGCCAATAGCPGETSSNCGLTCCCCPFGQVCSSSFTECVAGAQ